MNVNLARALLILASVATLAPLVFMLGAAFKPESEIFSAAADPLPLHPTLENLVAALTQLPFGHMLLVSVGFALGVTAGQLAIAVPAAYVFARAEIPFAGTLFGLTLATLPIPFVVTYVPNYLTLASLHLLNTLPGLIVPQLASAYGIFLLRQHFRSFPRSVLEAARIDGASRWQTLWRILVPANLPALIALAVYIFVNAWNQYIWPLLVASDPSLFTLTVGVQNFANGEGGNRWGALMAAALLATLPTVAAYLAVRRPLFTTLIEGAVTG
jgi:ABC-type glycerol-3-phosphate transport system permease component